MQTLRRVSGLCLAAGLCLCSAACGNRPRDAVRKGPIIVLTDTTLTAGGSDTVRFGRLRSGEIAVQRIWIENRATRPTAVVSCETSCGCTSLEFDTQPVVPGAAQCATLTFDSRGEYGWQFKTLDISLAGASRPLRLFVEAEIE